MTDMAKFDKVLFDKLVAKRGAVQLAACEASAKFRREVDELTGFIQNICPHVEQESKTYSEWYDSYNERYHTSTYVICRACNLSLSKTTT